MLQVPYHYPNGCWTCCNPNSVSQDGIEWGKHGSESQEDGSEWSKRDPDEDRQDWIKRDAGGEDGQDWSKRDADSEDGQDRIRDKKNWK